MTPRNGEEGTIHHRHDKRTFDLARVLAVVTRVERALPETMELDEFGRARWRPLTDPAQAEKDPLPTIVQTLRKEIRSYRARVAARARKADRMRKVAAHPAWPPCGAC